MTETRPAMVEVRSADGKLLCRLTSDGRVLEIVRRGARYHVTLGAVSGQNVLFVSALVEESDGNGGGKSFTIEKIVLE